MMNLFGDKEKDSEERDNLTDRDILKEINKLSEKQLLRLQAYMLFDKIYNADVCFEEMLEIVKES